METLICGNLVLALMKNPMPSVPSAVMVQQPGKALDALPAACSCIQNDGNETIYELLSCSLCQGCKMPGIPLDTTRWS